MLSVLALVVMAYIAWGELQNYGVFLSNLQAGFLVTCAVLIFYYRRRGTHPH